MEIHWQDVMQVFGLFGAGIVLGAGGGLGFMLMRGLLGWAGIKIGEVGRRMQQ